MPKGMIHDLDGMLISGTRFSAAYVEEFDIDPAPMWEFFEGPYKECILGRADLKEELAKGWLPKWKWRGSLDELLAYWWKQGATLNSELVGAIRTVRTAGVRCFVATNQEKYRAAFLKTTFDLENLFDKVFVSSELGCKKPEPAFFDRVMELLDQDQVIQPKDIMFWDDRPDYVEGARAYGFQAFLFIDTKGYLEEVHQQGIL